ncbi:MAG: hypothetical protein KBC44_03310 [Candidatus Pacebacteria bacterium]|nr:hypothetical protein [Candidatus Paceibacterota bacterium]
MSKEYGKNISPIFEELSDALWEIDAREDNEPYEYGEFALNHATKIFMSVIMDKLWTRMQAQDLEPEEMEALTIKLGEGLKQLIRDTLHIDMGDELTREIENKRSLISERDK